MRVRNAGYVRELAAIISLLLTRAPTKFIVEQRQLRLARGTPASVQAPASGAFWRAGWSLSPDRSARRRDRSPQGMIQALPLLCNITKVTSPVSSRSAAGPQPVPPDLLQFGRPVHQVDQQATSRGGAPRPLRAL